MAITSDAHGNVAVAVATAFRFTWTGAVLALVLTATTGAYAESAGEERARADFRDGVTLYERGDHVRALEKFRAAYRLWPNPAILTNIGSAAWKSGELAEAADAYARYLDEAPADASDRSTIEQALAKLTPKLATVVITERVGEGAQVTVDGRQVDAAHLGRVFVEPGPHTVAASGRDGRTEKTIKVGAGQRLAVVLEPEPGADTREAQGTQTGGTEAATAANSTPVASDTTGRDAGESTGGGSALPWIIGGVGVASLAASGVFFLMHRSATSELTDDCYGDVCDDSAKSTIDRANTFGTVSLITLGVGVVGVGVGVAMLIGDSDSQESTRARAGLEIGPGGSAMLRLGADL